MPGISGVFALALGKLLGSTDGMKGLASVALSPEGAIPGRLVFAEGSSCAEVKTDKKVTNKTVFIGVECSSGLRCDRLGLLRFQVSDRKPLENVPFVPNNIGAIARDSLNGEFGSSMFVNP